MKYCSKCGTKLSHEDVKEAAAEETESAGTEPVGTTEEPAHDADVGQAGSAAYNIGQPRRKARR